MFDIFYIGTKPNLFEHEREVSSWEQAQSLSRTRFFWMVNYLLDYSDFDFLWEPVPWEDDQKHVWASQHQPDSGTYLIPRQGFTETNYHAQVIRSRPDMSLWQVPLGLDMDSFDWSWHPNYSEPKFVYQFGTQWQKTGGPTYTAFECADIKYVESPRIRKLCQDDCWEVPADAYTESFDWSWHPDSTEQPFVYQFGTQHQKTGGPRYVVTGATDIKYVDQIHFNTTGVASAIVEIDHLDGNAGKISNVVKTVRYFDNYRDTLIRIAKSLEGQHEFVWICSSICDYSNFDFSWHPNFWQAHMLHVFPSNDQKFGDTFFMHVPSFAKRASDYALLEWFAVDYVSSKSVPRRPMPVICHANDSHVLAVKQTDFAGPLALFTNDPAINHTDITVPLWREKTKTMIPISHGATAVVVPKVAVPYIKTQLYDYPHIDRNQNKRQAPPLDIVFISNGEPNADDNWAKLLNVTMKTKSKVYRVDGVNGRAAAYHAAARASATPWFFAVFAKLEVDAAFDWAWQPDRMQQPKHYIFHARNPVNGLVYGHQAMIAYNRSLVLGNPGLGLDFTLDSAHETVPLLSGTAYYNHSAWMAWRTAFREVIKLKASLPDVENEYRLSRWLSSNSDGQTIVYEDWSRWGAEDGIEYYDSVSGDFAALKQSYEWSWLASYAFVKRGLTPAR